MDGPTQICNMALGRIGAKRINDLSDATDTKTEAIQCRLHYAQTRDALMRSHLWRFASHRKQLSEDTDIPAAEDFEWDHQFDLPNDFLRLKSIYEDNNTPDRSTYYSYDIEGTKILTNETSVYIRYIRRIIDTSKFDPLFTEVLVLLLADRFIGPLAGGDAKIQAKIDDALKKLMPKVRALDRQEPNTMGRADLGTWNDARLGGRIASRLG